MFVLLAALRREVRDLLPLLQKRSALPFGNHWGVQGRLGPAAVAVVCSGMGSRQAESTAAEVARSLRPEGVIIIGYAGALNKEARWGDLILAVELTDARGEERMGAPLTPNDSLLASARQSLDRLPLRCHVGGLVTAAAAASPSEKRLLAEKHEAIAADMESYPAAAILAKEGIPFLTVRAITDGVNDRVPDFRGLFTPSGLISVERAADHFIRHPGHIPSAILLGRASALAGRNLASFANAFVPVLAASAGGTRG